MKVLLTGATGFVGSHAYPALVAAGHEVVRASRDPRPDSDWIELDLARPATVESALAGCQAAIYLVHGMGGGAGAGDYAEREARYAETFLAAATAAGVERIVFLGGVLPSGKASKHLRSRAHTGEILRSGTVSTIELRAAMIIGAHSASWTMVRDLASRLPAMLLPRWLRNHSHPIAIDDVVFAILAALELDETGSRVYELPGPERISHRDLLRRVAAVFGHTRLMLNVPVLTPRLSSYWIALVTRVDLQMARELVEGVRHDLDPSGDSLWDRLEREPIGLEEAAKLALADERHDIMPSPQAASRARALGSRMSGAS